MEIIIYSKVKSKSLDTLWLNLQVSVVFLLSAFQNGVRVVYFVQDKEQPVCGDEIPSG